MSTLKLQTVVNCIRQVRVKIDGHNILFYALKLKALQGSVIWKVTCDLWKAVRTFNRILDSGANALSDLCSGIN